MLLLILLFLFCFTSNMECASFCDTGGGWKQVFKDDFNTLDQNSWTITLGSNSGQGRDAWLTADNVYVQNGNLVLRAQKQVVNGFNYTSGAITSQGKKYWSNARVCVYAKLPGGDHQYAQGVWPAHWLMPNDNSCWPDHGEVDIMEMINGDGQVHGSYHWNEGYPGSKCDYKDSSVSQFTTLANDGWANGLHEYATEWSNEHVAYLLDGKVYVNFTASSNKPSPQFPVSPMFLLLNTAIGGPWPGPPSPNTAFPNYHYIDYVAVSVMS